MPALPLSQIELNVIDGDSTRAEIVIALVHCNETAQRTATRDGLSKLNPEHGRLHRVLNYLLDMWQASA